MQPDEPQVNYCIEGTHDRIRKEVRDEIRGRAERWFLDNGMNPAPFLAAISDDTTPQSETQDGERPCSAHGPDCPRSSTDQLEDELAGRPVRFARRTEEA